MWRMTKCRNAENERSVRTGATLMIRLIDNPCAVLKSLLTASTAFKPAFSTAC